MTQTPQSVQDEKITDLLNAADSDRHDSAAVLRQDMQALQERVGAVEEAVAENTRLTTGIDGNTKEILDVFQSWKGAMKALDMIGTLAKPLSYIAMLGSALVGMWVAFKTGAGAAMMQAAKSRLMVAALSLSAAAFVGLTMDEGYVGQAMIPTKGDVPTLGFGSTTHADGRPVRMGDTTTPAKALARTLQYVQADEADMRKTLQGVALHQAEYDVYIDWRYQYGATAWRNSSMLRELKAGNDKSACESLLKYRFSAGYDCSTPGNRVCAGVWTRQLERHAACMAVQ